MPDLLLEIGLEEVPARMIASAEAELLKRTLALLTREQLVDPAQSIPAAHSYSTPRRLAVLIHDVLLQQPDITEDTTGPALKIAFKDGLPTPAAEAFARKSGIPVSDLKTISTPKGDYLAATTTKKGRTASEVLATELPKEIAALYFPKNMYWREHKPERFVRPVLWLACLLDDSVVPIQFAGRTAGRLTYGHRVLHGEAPITITSPATYLAQLESAHVLADVELRRHKIRKALDRVTREVPNARWREDHDLVDAVTHLTEWPDVLLGSFEPAYLTLPEEVLVTVMRDHQKYFAVEIADAPGAPPLDSEMGETKNPLAPHFLTVTNIALTADNAPIIRQGNERVLRARFNDARFFWEFDQRTPLADRVALLEHVTFQKDLGSYAKKTERVRVLAATLAGVASLRGATLHAPSIDKAATLAKTDLTTELVKEFTELQGIIGGLYARSQGLSATVADAIYDQYLPASANDAIPRSTEGCVLGLADRIDTIANMFALGMEPTGSKDPFALRRAANAVVKILAESTLPLTLPDVLTAAVPTPELLARLTAFFSERIDFYLREARGQAYDVVKAAMAAGTDDLRDLVARSEAVTAARGSDDFLAVSAAFKRMKNILAQATAKGDIAAATIDHDLLLDPAEKLLAVTASAAASAIEELQRERNYSEALRVIAALRPSIDDFFDKVMVMAPGDDLRANRLALLTRTLSDLSRIADFSEIVTAG